jgi:hypothetical protein
MGFFNNFLKGKKSHMEPQPSYYIITILNVKI